MLLALLVLVLAAPATAAADSGEQHEEPPASAAPEAGAEGEGPARTALNGGSPASAVTGEADRRDDREPEDERDADKPADDAAAAGRARDADARSGRSGDASSSDRSVADRAVGYDLDGLGEAIRRDTRSRTEGIRRRVKRQVEAQHHRHRGRARDESSHEGPAAEAEEGEIRLQWESGERVRLIHDRHEYRVGDPVVIGGYEPLRSPGRYVALQVFSGGRWVDVVSTRTVEDGRFELVWRPRYPGRYQVRVRPRRGSVFEPSEVHWIFAFRRAVASWYGPGFYGNRTACGQTFSSRLMGVAHRSLPCGYLVRVRYNGRSRTVPVVDRGPYIDGRDYDLTEALRNYLGFDGVDRILATA